jgi:amino acid transporter
MAQVTYAAEETHNPERIIPRALMIGTARGVDHLALNSAACWSPFMPLKSTHIAFDATGDSRSASARRSRSW